MLVTTKEMFKKSMEEGFAIGAFNVNNMEIIQGIVDCTLYAPQICIIFFFIGTITYNMANNKMIRKIKFSRNKKKENNNKDIVI